MPGEASSMEVGERPARPGLTGACARLWERHGSQGARCVLVRGSRVGAPAAQRRLRSAAAPSTLGRQFGTLA